MIYILLHSIFFFFGAFQVTSILVSAFFITELLPRSRKKKKKKKKTAQMYSGNLYALYFTYFTLFCSLFHQSNL